MRSLNVALLLSNLILMLTVPVLAQDSLIYRRASVAFLPQYLISQAIRIDIEKPIGKQPHRLTFSPYLYAGMSSQFEDQRDELPSSIDLPEDYGKDKVTGFGLEVTNKHLLREMNGRVSNWYIAYGAGFHHIQLQYQSLVPTPFTDGELEYYEFTLADQQEEVNRLDLMGMIGIKLFLTNNNILFVDLYTGPIYKHSWIDSSQDKPRNHEEPLSFGFTGATFRAGISLGVMLF